MSEWWRETIEQQSAALPHFSENTGFCIVVRNSHMINDEIKHFGCGNLYW